MSSVELYVVAAIPKPRAGVTTWLVELEARGPFPHRAGAYAYARELERKLADNGASSSYTVRTFRLLAPERDGC